MGICCHVQPYTSSRNLNSGLLFCAKGFTTLCHLLAYLTIFLTKFMTFVTHVVLPMLFNLGVRFYQHNTMENPAVFQEWQESCPALSNMVALGVQTFWTLEITIVSWRQQEFPILFSMCFLHTQPQYDSNSFYLWEVLENLTLLR